MTTPRATPSTFPLVALLTLAFAIFVNISVEMLPKIFELFTREGRHPDISGEGVGLAVVKQLASAHGGFVEARSAGHDKGAVFSLRIPVHRQT